MKALIDRAKKEGDTVGGIYEVVALGVPMGLGSTMNWDEKLDARLAQGLVSCQAIKGVSIGIGFDVADTPGSRVHDAIGFDWNAASDAKRQAREAAIPQEDDEPGSPGHKPGSKPLQKRETIAADPLPGRGPSGGFYHLSNNAGGIEGGMSNGEPIILRAAMKPIATLMKPLQSVDIESKEPSQALRERTDSCTVPAAGVVGEAMVALVLADAYRKKFGGDHVDDVRAAVDAYRARLRNG